MNNRRQLLSILLMSAFMLFSAGQVSADWDIAPLNMSYVQTPVSNSSTSVRIVNLSGDVDGEVGDEGINKTKLNGNNKNMNYIYNKSGGTRASLKWMHHGYYYTEFNPDNITGDYFYYELRKDDGTVEKEWTERLSFGNMTVENLRNYNSEVEPDKTFDIKVNVTDAWNDKFEDEADVDLYLTNVSWTSEIYNIDNKGDSDDSDNKNDFYKNFGLNFNLAHNKTYVMHINASNTSKVGYEDSNGSTSVIIQTLPALESEIAYLNTSSQGCNNQSFFSECERNVTIQTGLNITAASASDANLTLRYDKKNGGMVDNKTIELTQSGSLWKASFEFPDINTSKYEKKVQLHYNATSSNQETIENYNISYRSYTITDKSASKTTPGDYEVRIEFSKYFSPTPLGNDRMKNATINITDPDNKELTSFNLSEMTYDSSEGVFEKTIDIPLDATTGSYITHITAYNLYGEMKTHEGGFTLSDVDQTFEITESEIDREINKTGVTEVNLTVENLLSGERNLTTEFSGDIENFTSVSGGKVELSGDEKKNVTVEFNVSYVDSYDGEIKFMDSESTYNETVDVEISGVSCDERDEEVCIQHDGLNVSSGQKGYITETFDAVFLGDRDAEKQMTLSFSGNISDHITADPSGFTVNETHDIKTVSLNYSVQKKGYFEGTLTAGTSDYEVKLPISLDSNIEEQDKNASFTVTTSLDLGKVEKAGSAKGEITVENTGEVKIDSLSYSSSRYTVNGESVSIAPGSSQTVTLDLSGIRTGSATVTVTASTSAGEISEEVQISAEIVPDYIRRANRLESRLTSLDAKVTDSALQTQLNNAQPKITRIKTAYRNGNYAKAERLYNQVSRTVTRLESQTAETGSTTSKPASSPASRTQTGGSSMMVPLIVGVLVFLLAGFVAYTSIIPEEGDPLYNVLGEG